mgnify:CR=1 FL=1
MNNNLNKTKVLNVAQQLEVFGGVSIASDHEALSFPNNDCNRSSRKSAIFSTPNDLYVPPPCTKY